MIEEVLKTKKGKFKPAPQFKTLYFSYLFLSVVFFVLPWFIPVAIFAPFALTVFFLTIILPILFLVMFWIPYYYDTIHYQFTDTDIEWRRGVWFKKTGIVPYNRITNVDVEQGPLSRMLGFASLKIQTAGYSAPSAGGIAEMRIVAVEQFEELRDVIMGYVRGRKPEAVETYEEVPQAELVTEPHEESISRVVEELVKIRKLLEKQT